MKAIVVCSGGMDSATLAYYYKSLPATEELILVSFDYGQRHRKELDYAAMIAKDLESEHIVVDLSGLASVLKGSALTDNIEVPEGHYCLAPGTKVLCTDLVWRCIEDLTVGDAIVGFDEAIGKGAIAPSKVKESIVESTSIQVLPSFRITTDRGPLVASSDHSWVTRRGSVTSRRWRKTCDLLIGDELSSFVEPWEVKNSYGAGYLAGFMDGEASIHDQGLCFSQNPGDTLDRVKFELKQFGFEVGGGFLNTKGNDRCLRFYLSGDRMALRFIGMFQPRRFQKYGRDLWEGKALAGGATKPYRILDIEPLGLKEVVALSTSTRTLLADGFLSHNSDQNMRLTVVPNRNMIMLSVAVGIAVAQDASDVATAVHAGDHAIYPDCRPAFIDAMNHTARTATQGFALKSLRINAPFVYWSKDMIAKEGDKLGVPWQYTWSCYKGLTHHCGVCGTCTERKEAFQIAGIDDPTEYDA